MKKLPVVILPLVVFAVLAVAPLSASADTVFKCSHDSADYCMPVVKCVVPELRGDTVAQARALLAAHDCALGKVHHHQGGNVAVGTIIKSDPSAGTMHHDGKKVDVQVRS
jgi:beta-lactam-binding protein with PASTA domain